MIVGAGVVGCMAIGGQVVTDIATGTTGSMGDYFMLGFRGAASGAICSLIPVGGGVLGVGLSSVVEGMVDRFIRGEDTDFMSMISDFVIGAATFGIGDNVVRGLKSTAQKLAKTSGKKLTNKLPKIELKQLKNTTRKQCETKSKAKFRDLMSAKEVARYDKYWDNVAEKIRLSLLKKEELLNQEKDNISQPKSVLLLT